MYKTKKVNSHLLHFEDQNKGGAVGLGFLVLEREWAPSL